MISAHSSSRIAYDYGINELRDGLRDMDLSDHQMNKMWDYVRELWNRQQGKQVQLPGQPGTVIRVTNTAFVSLLDGLVVLSILFDTTI